MDRQNFLEFIRMVLIAFAIAFVINCFRVLIFEGGNFQEAFSRRNNTNNETVRTNTHNNVNTAQYIIQKSKNKAAINADLKDEIINIPITPLECLSGLSRNEIFELRKEAVKTSPIYSNMNYTPSDSVFQIVDGLPWISADGALNWSKYTNSLERTYGVTRDSLGILNPELLYYLVIITFNPQKDGYKYLYNSYDVMPHKVTYNPTDKTITAYIRNERNTEGNFFPLRLADANAHDLGYNYAYMNKKENIGFFRDEPYNSDRLDTDIKDVVGHYKRGTSCGVPGGCNNYAPYWQYYNNLYLKSLPASFNIKLWKERPTDVNQAADINFQMVFE